MRIREIRAVGLRGRTPEAAGRTRSVRGLRAHPGRGAHRRGGDRLRERLTNDALVKAALAVLRPCTRERMRSSPSA